MSFINKLFGKEAIDKTVYMIISKKFYYGVMEAKTWSIEKNKIIVITSIIYCTCFYASYT